MEMGMRKVLGLVGATLLFAGPALAADLSKPVYKAPAAPVYLSDWAGFYIGFNGGYGWGHTSFTGGLTEKPKGGIFGGHAGYNWQYGQVVAGVEVDFDGADLKKTDAGGVEQKTNELASARGRIGYVFFPSLLAYGTAGAGWGHTEFNAGPGLTDGISQFGWTAGAGLEYKLVDHVLLRAEYLHYDFSRTSVPNVFGDSVKETADVVRGGLSWKF